MTVEILSNDNGSGMTETLTVYKCYNEQQKLFEVKPYCLIDQDKFFDLLPDSAFDKAQKGKTQFNVSLSKLQDSAIRLYR